jgi:hypothetical protein
MKLTTEQVLELLGDCLGEWNEDVGLVATMISQLCPFWDGPTFGLATPRVKVWWTDNDSHFACSVEFSRQVGDARLDLNAIAEHLATLKFAGQRVFFAVNVFERIHCHRIFVD